jgi:MFS family permease
VYSLAVVIGPGLGGLAAGAWGLPTMFVLAALIGSLAVVAMALALSRRRVPVEAVG